LTPVLQGWAAAFVVLAEQIKLRCTGGLERFRQHLLIVQKIWKCPAMALGLLRQLCWTVLGMGDQTIAAESNELDPRSEVVLKASDLRFDVLYEGAMGAQHHQQDWLLLEFR
jgi:hypothetical protein